MRVTAIALAAALLIPTGACVAADTSLAATVPKAGMTEFSAARKKPKNKPAQEQFMRAAPSK